MKTHVTFSYSVILVLLLVLPGGGAAAGVSPFTTTYTINLQEDGSALWQLEYRTLLTTDSDLAAFNTYASDLPSVYLPQVQDLMQRSAAQASVAASRPMAVSNVTGNTVVQTSPTGRYGIVMYSFSWSGFARPDESPVIGEAFAGGLYLAKDNTLILRYPSSWTVTRAEPVPDEQRDGLVWYGLRTFGPGEPRVTFERSSSLIIPLIVVLLLISLAGAGALVYRRKKRGEMAGESRAEPDEPPAPLSEAEAAGLEERITHLLQAAGGEQYQSEIVKTLGIPKSTVSSALNTLHAKGVIAKVRKGRENLIRLVKDRM